MLNINLDDLEKIKQAKSVQAAAGMLKLANTNSEESKSLPSNLRKRANEILYSKP